MAYDTILSESILTAAGVPSSIAVLLSGKTVGEAKETVDALIYAKAVGIAASGITRYGLDGQTVEQMDGAKLFEIQRYLSSLSSQYAGPIMLAVEFGA